MFISNGIKEIFCLWLQMEVTKWGRWAERCQVEWEQNLYQGICNDYKKALQEIWVYDINNKYPMHNIPSTFDMESTYMTFVLYLLLRVKEQ